MDFGWAIQQIKQGKVVCRSGWNGKNMYIYLSKGSFDRDLLGFQAGEHPHENHPSTMNGVSISHFECGDIGTVTRMPNLNMKAADGSTFTGWLASQTDMLAEDWVFPGPGGESITE